MAERLQRPIADPILRLAWTAKLVTGSRDYSIPRCKTIRGRGWHTDRRLHEMLAQIQIRDAELSGAREEPRAACGLNEPLELEQEVGDRQRTQEALHESEGRIRLLLDRRRASDLRNRSGRTVHVLQPRNASLLVIRNQKTLLQDVT